VQEKERKPLLRQTNMLLVHGGLVHVSIQQRNKVILGVRVGDLRSSDVRKDQGYETLSQGNITRNFHWGRENGDVEGVEGKGHGDAPPQSTRGFGA